MKSNSMLRGSSAGLAAVINAKTTIGFLTDRSHSLDVEPIGPSARGYVWRRIFLQSKGGHRA